MAEPAQPGKEEREALLAQYEFARENRNTADAIGWEMTAITWGAQTLLLGFSLEAIDHSSAQPLIPFVAVFSIVLSIFNHNVMSSRRSVANSMNEVCFAIEKAMGMRFRPQHQIGYFYPRKKQYSWFLAVNYAIAGLWIVVALRAIGLYWFAKR